MLIVALWIYRPSGTSVAGEVRTIQCLAIHKEDGFLRFVHN